MAGRLFPQAIHGPVAVFYDRVVAPGFADYHGEVAADVARAISSGEVLDVGTGPGALIIEIARRRPDLRITGFDLSPTMLGLARRNCRRAGVTNVAWRLGDVAELPFEAGSFDLVVSTSSIHHWSDPVRGLAECARVLKPGGGCFIYDLRRDAPLRALARLASGRSRLAKAALALLFKPHGIRPADLQPEQLARKLGSNGTLEIRLMLKDAYARLSMERKRP